ncbi:MAG TPA: MFS transporter [Candidatus Limnocylindria bacterium]|nr:MFS transporter [Candidatus Limnocylindria bacterium]
MRLAVALLSLGAIAFGFTYADHAPLIPLVAADFGLSDLGVGLLSTALFTTYMATTLLTTGLAEQLGPKRMVGAGLAVSAAGTVAFAAAPSYSVALVAKAIQGIGSALAFVAAARYLAGLYGERRNHFALGLYGGGFPLGSAIALVAMPPLAAALGGWRGAFWAEAAFVGTAAALWWRAPSVPRVARPGNIRDALRCANCWWTSLQHVAGFGLGISSGTWITVYLLREFRLPLELSGLLGSLLLVLAVLARPIGGLLLAREHVPTRRVMRIGDLAIVVGVALLAIPGRPLPIALGGAILVGIGVGLPYSAVFNTAAASLPGAPGAAQGLAAIGGTGGVMVGAPAMGYAVQTFGFWAAWLFVGVISAVAFVGTTFMRGEEDLPGGRSAPANPRP